MLSELELKGRCLERLMEISADGFVLVDADSKIIEISQAYCDKLGRTRVETIGKHAMDVLLDSQLPGYIASGTKLFEKDAIHRLRKDIRPYDDEYCFVSRGAVFSGDQVIGAVSQVQFVEKTEKLSKSMKALNEQLEFYKDELHRLSAEYYSLNKIIGDSPEMRRVKEAAMKASEVDFNVLLTGKTGSGKEVFANAIHYASGRRTKPMIKINCSAIPAELFESELFGYAEGSFTGAKKGGKKGKFELANGGTIFLDEIADMPLAMQVKLLRVLQERQVDVIGSDKSIPVDVRVIAATNKNLEELVKDNKFREDLFYRLNVINIHIPSLKERREDIPILMDSFLDELNDKYDKEINFSDEVVKLCVNYNWPGNIRELRNAVERMYTFVEGDEIRLQHVPAFLLQGSTEKFSNGGEGTTLEDLLNEVERNYLAGILRENEYNFRKTAEILGMHRNTLYRKLEKHNLTRDNMVKEGMTD